MRMNIHKLASLTAAFSLLAICGCRKDSSVQESENHVDITVYDLEGSWLLTDRVDFDAPLPPEIEIQCASNKRFSISPPLQIAEEKVGEFEVETWHRSDYPTSLRTRRLVDIHFLGEGEIGIQTGDMDVFGLGAYYQKK